MAFVTVPLKKWGNSLGVIIPADVVEKEGLSEKERVVIEVRKTSTLQDLFGSMKHTKLDAQKLKDEARENW